MPATWSDAMSSIEAGRFLPSGKISVSPSAGAPGWPLQFQFIASDQRLLDPLPNQEHGPGNADAARGAASSKIHNKTSSLPLRARLGSISVPFASRPLL